jgi:hypothetical protein
MDSWSNEQVEVRVRTGNLPSVFATTHPSLCGLANVTQNMKKVGNSTSNRIYNPQNRKAAMPIDVDEVDSAMERFIRSKYVMRNLDGDGKRNNIGSRDSDEGPPPPLPPKTGKFGLRAATSIFPMSSKAKRQAAAREAMASTRDLGGSPSPRLPNKPSKVFGASVEYSLDDMDKKLTKLRDMGFTDNSRNTVVLRGVNGSLERAIEALVRLGEGDRKSPVPIVSPRESSLRATRSLTPLSGASSPRPAQDRPTTPSTISSNPFDALPAQPQTAQSTGTLQNKNPYFPSTNPFGLVGQNDAMAQAFQNMSLSPAQPLFPNHTGGVPGHSTQPAYYQAQPPMSNPGPLSFSSHQTYPPPPMQPFAVPSPQVLQPQMTGYNPFFADQTQQMRMQVPQQIPQQMPQQNLSVNTNMMLGAYGNNPFTRSPTRLASPLGQIPEQAQYVTSNLPVQQPAATNPFFAQPNMAGPAQSPFQTMPPGQPTMPAQQQQLPPQRPDNASILALYNYPHLAPRPYMADQQAAQAMDTVAQQPLDAQQPRSIPSAAMPGSKNPFLNGSNPASPTAVPAVPTTTNPFPSTNPFPTMNGHHGSRDSVQLGMDMATWANGGRHSPDAFASLSAKHV